MSVTYGSNTIQQRRPLSEVSGKVQFSKSLPDESESDDEVDGYAHLQQQQDRPGAVTNKTNSSLNDDSEETDWIAADKVKSKGASVALMSGLSAEEKQKVDALIDSYAIADDKLAWWMVQSTTAAFLLLTLFIPIMVHQSILVWFPWLLITAGLRVRLFILFHDCGHNSLFSKFRDNMRVGAFLELLVGTPFSLWLKRHNRHHRIQGNSDKLDLSSTIPLTDIEYLSLPRAKRYIFRVVREPIVFFFVAPFLIWDFFYVIANGTKRILLSRGACMLYFAAAFYFRMSGTHAPVTFTQALLWGFAWEHFFTWLPGLMGLILFHLQHSANGGYRSPESLFSPKDTALLGSTYVTIPWFLRWITLNIEFHHIHHWSTRVPCYRLEDCHNAGEKMGLWKGVTRIDSLGKFLEAMPNALWSEKLQQYIPFSKLSI